MGYTARDESLVQATRIKISPYADAIAAGLYARLLSHPETADFFTLADGRPDRAHVDARAETFKVWLQTAIEAPLDERAATYLASVGRAHTGRGGNPQTRVKGRYLLAAISIIYAELIGVLDREIADRRLFVDTVTAWSKLLALHLDLFLAVYGSAEGNPHWY